MEIPFAESYRMKVVENIRKGNRHEREKWLKEAKYNMFYLRSDQVFIDLLTDSGNGAMSDKQWSAMMLGDESYAGSSSYHNLKKAAKEILGFPYILPTHQGRGAENVLFFTLVKNGDMVPGNTLHDTTQKHVDFKKAISVDCTIEGASNPSLNLPFKGNVDLIKLEDVLSKNPRDQIPMVMVTVTCNATGGQPVSMENLKAVKKLADKYGVPVCFDSARFAENAYFIKSREKGYKDRQIRKIVLEMFSFADMTVMSCKKDCMVNIGGLLCFKDETIWRKAINYNILCEGYISYGGMAGRDVNALAQGLYEAVDFTYLDTRIRQVQYLAGRLEEFGIPFMKPVGGHAVLLDARTMFSDIPNNELPAQVLGCELYLEAGIRGLQLGSQAKHQFWRLAIPRRSYTNSHMDVIAVALKNLYDRRHSINRGFRVKKTDSFLPYYTMELERL